MKRGYNCLYSQPKKEYLQKQLLTGQVQKPLTTKQKKKDFEIHSFRYDTPNQSARKNNSKKHEKTTDTKLSDQENTRYHPYHNQNQFLPSSTSHQKHSNLHHSAQYIDNFVDAFGFDPSSSNVLKNLHSFLDEGEEDSDKNSKELDEMLMQDMIVTSFVKINSFEYYHRHIVYGFRIFSEELIEKSIFGNDLKNSMNEIFRNPNSIFELPDFSNHTGEYVVKHRKTEILSLLYTLHAVTCASNGFLEHAESSIKRSIELSFEGYIQDDIQYLYEKPTTNEQLIDLLVGKHSRDVSNLIIGDYENTFFMFRVGRYLLASFYFMGDSNLGLARYFLLKSDEMLDIYSPNYRDRAYINYSIVEEAQTNSDYSLYRVENILLLCAYKYRLICGMTFDSFRNYIQKSENSQRLYKNLPPLELTKTSINLRESPQYLFDLNCMRLATSLYLSARGKLPSELLIITTLKNVNRITVDNIEIYLMIIILMTKDSNPGLASMNPSTFSLIQLLRKFSIYSTTVSLLGRMIEQCNEDDRTYQKNNEAVLKLETIFKNFENGITGELSRLVISFSNITDMESQQIMNGTAPNHPSIFSILSANSLNQQQSRTPTSVKSTLEKLLVVYCDKYVDNLKHFK